MSVVGDLWIDPFWDKVTFGDCWEWTASINGSGYGRHTTGLAHREAYRRVTGQLTAGTELDHLCRNRKCVRPAHLEQVSHAENSRRAHPGCSDACPRGHSYTTDNTYQYKNSTARYCRQCNRDAANRLYRSKQHG